MVSEECKTNFYVRFLNLENNVLKKPNYVIQRYKYAAYVITKIVKPRMTEFSLNFEQKHVECS